MEINKDVFIYNWSVKEEQDQTTIKIFGITEDYKNVFIKVEDYIPYIYLELPDDIEWTEHRVKNLSEKIKNLAPSELFQPVICKLFYKRKLYYFSPSEFKNGKYIDKTYPFMFVAFRSSFARDNMVFKFKDKIDIPGLYRIKLNVHEYEKRVSPVLNLMSLRKLPACGWISVDGILLDDAEKESSFDLEISCSFKKLKPCVKDSVLFPKILTFDIEANSSNIETMPDSQNPKDKIYMISLVTFYKNEVKNYLYTFVPVFDKEVGENVNVVKFKDEADLLIGFRDFIVKENVCVINGYNTLGWDLKYMLDRAKLLNILDDFLRIGCSLGVKAEIKDNSFSSKAYSSQSLYYLDADGRLFMDLLPIIKREYKLRDYKLKTVTKYFGVQTKDPLTAKDLFSAYREYTAEKLSPVAKYCWVDSYVTHLLFNGKLQVWLGLCEMAKTAHVPILYLYTEGTQIQMFSQVMEYCVYNNYVIHKGFYTCKYDEYQGATVLTPVPGRYERVTVYDFQSLYPSIIMSHNIDYHTFIDEDNPNSKNIPEEHCWVFNFEDHVSCLVGDSYVSSRFLSYRIDESQRNKRIMSYNMDKNGTELQDQTDFMIRGKKQCIEITLEDGRTIKCTPDHRFLTANNMWKEIKDVNIGERLKVGLDNPKCSENEWKQYRDWNYKITDEFCLKMDTLENYEKTLSFVRLLGLVLTDGCITTKSVVYCGHMNDVKDVYYDIKNICGYFPKSRRTTNTFDINIPFDIYKLYCVMKGVVKGRRITQESTLPEFINRKCPLPILREFLAGMFGGDGRVSSLGVKNNFGHISLCKSKIKKYEQNLEGYMKIIGELLELFKIKTYQIKQNRKDDKLTIRLMVKTEDNIKFYDSIGFRYCCHKNIRMMAMISYLKMKEKVCEQRKFIIEKTKEFMNSSESISSAFEKSKKLLTSSVPLFNDYYSIPKYCNITQLIKKNKKTKNSQSSMFQFRYFPTVKKYLESIEALEFFNSHKYGVKYNSRVLPTINLKLVYKKDIGEHEVFDLSVNKNRSFIANGMIVHNCVHDPNRKMKKDGTESKAKRKVICGKRYFRYIKKEYGGDGIVPTLLKNLLDSRKKTRSKIKDNEKELIHIIHTLLSQNNNDEYLVSLKKERPDWFSEIPKDLGKLVLQNISTERIKDLIVLNRMLDKRQASYKICANSMYGAMGVKKGYLPLMEAAMSVTYRGRKSIEKISEWIPKTYNGKSVYGDSVTGNTPIMLKINGNITFKTLNEITNDKWNKSEYSDKFFSDNWNNYLVWSANGWSKIKRVIKHKTNKKIFRVNTHTGLVDVTEDHSLLTKNCEKIKPKDCKIGDELKHFYPVNKEKYFNTSVPETLEEKKAFLYGFFYGNGYCEEYKYKKYTNYEWIIHERHMTNDVSCILFELYDAIREEFSMMECFIFKIKIQDEKIGKEFREQFYNGKYKKVPDYILNSSKNIKKHFMDGYNTSIKGMTEDILYRDKGQIGDAGIYYLMKCLGNKCLISWYKKNPNVCEITEYDNELNLNIIKKINEISYKDLGEDGDEIDVFDITTEDHTFQAGIGQLIVHNTDSVMVYFPHLNSDKDVIELAEKIIVEIDKQGFFPPPMKLDFEKMYKKYLILTKKRYLGEVANKKGEIIDFTKKGIVLTRRDNCKVLTDIYSKISRMILDGIGTKDEIMNIIVNYLNDMFSMKFPLEDFVITKSLSKNAYKAKTKPVHVVIADKMNKRGVTVTVGSRIEYLFTTKCRDDKKVVQGDKGEDIEYFKFHKDILRIDYLYYLEKQIVKPIDEILQVGLGIKEFMKSQYLLRYNKYLFTQEIDELSRPKIIIEGKEVVKKRKTVKIKSNPLEVLEKKLDSNKPKPKRKIKKRFEPEKDITYNCDL